MHAPVSEFRLQRALIFDPWFTSKCPCFQETFECLYLGVFEINWACFAREKGVGKVSKVRAIAQKC